MIGCGVEFGQGDGREGSGRGQVEEVAWHAARSAVPWHAGPRLTHRSDPVPTRHWVPALRTWPRLPLLDCLRVLLPNSPIVSRTPLHRLTILETAIRKEGVRMVRIDGQVASVDERAARVHAFQTCPDILVFLLSSAVGGLGLTLTAADRVIMCVPG